MIRIRRLDAVYLAWLVAAMLLPFYPDPLVRTVLLAAFLPLGAEFLRSGAAPDGLRIGRDALAFFTFAAVVYVPSAAVTTVAFVAAILHTYDTQQDALHDSPRRIRQEQGA